ncbi:hypothetical protein LbFV_ORF42 [Leptopilina boulardi filamentous virus]|uniref:Uncharacterized protein n=1 Tax=Leptopilina boulardi filamentous virus TaxID=552509 RepID=A0A1S5YD33_9VIRU|nr:hypothetical protein LbFV_ORF42 [Leptopilina boulardi filamentous virus]AQQ79962.1 hypothetical protein LbFV_ORF42 [Leptopilina boulardi filamentous virus]
MYIGIIIGIIILIFFFLGFFLYFHNLNKSNSMKSNAYNQEKPKDEKIPDDNVEKIIELNDDDDDDNDDDDISDTIDDKDNNQNKQLSDRILNLTSEDIVINLRRHFNNFPKYINIKSLDFKNITFNTSNKPFKDFILKGYAKHYKIDDIVEDNLFSIKINIDNENNLEINNDIINYYNNKNKNYIIQRVRLIQVNNNIYLQINNDRNYYLLCDCSRIAQYLKSLYIYSERNINLLVK